MKRLMKHAVLATVLVLGLLGAAGCGGGGDAVQGDPAPFEAAMQDYFRTKSFGLQVKEFESLSVNGETATAQARLIAAEEGAPGVSVHWAFTFAKTPEGWKVTGHEVK